MDSGGTEKKFERTCRSVKYGLYQGCSMGKMYSRPSVRAAFALAIDILGVGRVRAIPLMCIYHFTISDVQQEYK